MLTQGILENGEDVEVEQESMPYVIDEEELLLQSFCMDNPTVEPCGDDFTLRQFAAAREVLQFTDKIDKEFAVEILDDKKPVVSRDVLATYKMLLYRAIYDAKQKEAKLKLYRAAAVVLAVSLGVVSVMYLSK